MCIRSFYVHYNLPLNAVQLFVFEVLFFHETIELIPPGDSSDLSPGNYDPIEGITIVLIGVSISNKIGWVEVEN